MEYNLFCEFFSWGRTVTDLGTSLIWLTLKRLLSRHKYLCIAHIHKYIFSSFLMQEEFGLWEKWKYIHRSTSKFKTAYAYILALNHKCTFKIQNEETEWILCSKNFIREKIKSYSFICLWGYFYSIFQWNWKISLLL